MTRTPGSLTLKVVAGASMALTALAGCSSARHDEGATPVASASSAPVLGAAPTASVASVETVPTTSPSTSPSVAPKATAHPPSDPPTVESALPELAGLPAFSKSKSVVAYLGDESEPSCRKPLLLLLDVKSDTTSKRIRLAEDGCDAPVPARVDEAKKALSAETWTPFQSLSMEEDPAHPPLPDPAMGPLQRAVDARTVITFTEPTLTITVDGTTVVRKAFPAWSDKGGRNVSGVPCPKTHPILDHAWIDTTARIALIEIDYAGGNDMCGEPDDAFHPVTF